MRLILVIIVFILSACQPVESSVKPVPQEQENHQASQRDANQDHHVTDEKVKYPPNSHIREEDIQSALENLAEQETPIGVKDKIDRERQDLVAQKSMADYTLGMFLLGIPTLIVSIVGVWAIIATLKQTKDALGIASAANTAADKAADAAVASVKITRDMGAAQTRAYIEVKKVTFEPYLKAHIVNTGSTPALWYEISSVSQVFEPRGDTQWRELVDFSKASEFTRWSAVANELTTRISPEGWEDNKAEAMSSYEKAMLVYGVVRYETIFNEIFESQYVVVAKDGFSKGNHLPRAPMHLKSFNRVSNQETDKG